MASIINVDNIRAVGSSTTAINIDSNDFVSGIMYSAGRQSLASANGYTWTGIPSTAKKIIVVYRLYFTQANTCLLYTSPSPRDQRGSRMPSSA